VELDY